MTARRKDSEIMEKSNKITIAYIILLTIQAPFNIYFFLKLILGSSGRSTEQIQAMFKTALIGYGIIAIIYFLVVGILGILNITKAFKLYSNGDVQGSVRSMLIMKYGMVPFFVMNFLAMAFLFITAVMGSRGLIIIFGWPIILGLILFGICCTWIAMIPGMCYSIQVLRFTKREGKISSGGFVWHTILQLCFLTDVLDTMYIAVRKWNKGKKGAIVIGLLYVIVIAFFIKQFI